REVFAGRNVTSGGLSETLENDWQVIPTGSPLEIAVTTVTPLQYRPSTSRNRRAAACASSSSAGTSVDSPARSSIPTLPRKESMSSCGGQEAAASADMPSGMSWSDCTGLLNQAC